MIPLPFYLALALVLVNAITAIIMGWVLSRHQYFPSSHKLGLWCIAVALVWSCLVYGRELWFGQQVCLDIDSLLIYVGLWSITLVQSCKWRVQTYV